MLLTRRSNDSCEGGYVPETYREKVLQNIYVSMFYNGKHKPKKVNRSTQMKKQTKINKLLIHCRRTKIKCKKINKQHD